MFGRKKKPRSEEAAEPRFTATVLPSRTAARQAAAGGDPAEMNRLGTRLKLDGKDDEAAEWFRKAADAGNNDAMANLATYLMARGRNREAAEWFRRAGGPLGEALAQQLSQLPDDPTPR